MEKTWYYRQTRMSRDFNSGQACCLDLIMFAEGSQLFKRIMCPWSPQSQMNALYWSRSFLARKNLRTSPYSQLVVKLRHQQGPHWSRHSSYETLLEAGCHNGSTYIYQHLGLYPSRKDHCLMLIRWDGLKAVVIWLLHKHSAQQVSGYTTKMDGFPLKNEIQKDLFNLLKSISMILWTFLV